NDVHCADRVNLCQQYARRVRTDDQCWPEPWSGGGAIRPTRFRIKYATDPMPITTNATMPRTTSCTPTRLSSLVGTALVEVAVCCRGAAGIPCVTDGVD